MGAEPQIWKTKYKAYVSADCLYLMQNLLASPPEGVLVSGECYKGYLEVLGLLILRCLAFSIGLRSLRSVGWKQVFYSKLLNCRDPCPDRCFTLAGEK